MASEGLLRGTGLKTYWKNRRDTFGEGLWLQDGLFRQKKDGKDIYNDDGVEK